METTQSSAIHTPSVSVIIPLYNKATYISRAIDSVLAQTVQDFEIVVVNDGSTDGGEKIVESYADARIHLINQENQGVSAARNHGVDAAGAELVAFLDADDEWLPEFLETIFRLRSKWPEAGLYGTGYYELFSLNERVSHIWKNSEGERLMSSYFQEAVDSGQCVVSASSFATLRSIYASVGGCPIGRKWAEDRALYGRIALLYPLAYSPVPLALYYRHTINNSSILARQYHPTSSIVEDLRSIPNEQLMKRTDYNALIDYVTREELACARHSIYSGYGKLARKNLRNINSQRYGKERNQLIFQSYVPKICWRFIRSHIELPSKIKRKMKNIISISKM